MTRISDLFAAGPTYSFEFFPPKTEEAEKQLEKALHELEPLHPSFVSVTYGAGGSTRERTQEVVLDVLHNTTMTPMSHLTCAAHSRADLVSILQEYQAEGLENILALRGDPPVELHLPPGELAYAIDLVDLLREVAPFSVGVAAHPEGHPASTNREDDLLHQATKIQHADFGITQFFFRIDDYLKFRDEMNARGVTKPIIPGIMPVTNVKQIQRFAQLSGAAFPEEIAARFKGAEEDPERMRQIGVELATELCTQLLAENVPGLHFYTLNRSTATKEIYTNLDLPI